MSETASPPDLTVVLSERVPAEACANCETFSPLNRRLLVVEVGAEDAAPRAQGAVCAVCVEHYGEDGVAVRLWPDLCTWVPMRIFDDCQCETCTGQIEFRMTAGTDFNEGA